MGGKKSPHLGKLGGTGGKSACVPTWTTRFIPMTMWNRKWQWKSQYPEKNNNNRLGMNNKSNVRKINTNFTCLRKNLFNFV